MRVIDLALKDLLQIARDRRSALFLVAMPVVFTFFFGWITGGFAGEEDPRLPVGFVDRDAAGALGAELQSLLEGSDAIRLVPLEGDSAQGSSRSVAEGDLAAAVILPAGFSQQVLDGSAPGLTMIADRGSQAGRTAVNAVEVALGRLKGIIQTARLSLEAMEARGSLEGEAARRAYFEEALARAAEAWRRPPLTVAVERSGTTVEEGGGFNSFGQSSPGMIVQFAVFGLTTSSMVLVLERRSGALGRMMTTPIRRVEVIAGHVLAMFVVVLLQQAVLIVFGQFVFGLGYLSQPLATLSVALALGFWASSLGLLIGVVSKTEEQVVIFAMVAMFLFSALGGAWFPLEVTGQTFATVGHLTPTAWAMDGFQNLILRGLGLESVVLPVGILLAYGATFFALAVWRFRVV